MKFYIKTYGCQMNERDSESVGVKLSAKGYIQTFDENDADVLLFNTCSVREQAERKAIGKIGILKKMKKKRPNIFIGIMGCMAQSKGEELLKQLPHVDFIVGTEQLHKLPDIINAELNKRYKEVAVDSDIDVLTSLDGHISSDTEVSAYIAIMRGCNRFCSYCIVPYVRGREKSREKDDILKETQLLVQQGIKEIVLLGQNVAAYGLDGEAPSLTRKESPFADLLYELNEIKGLERIRFLSPHPAYFNNKLINTIIDCNKVCNNIHLPLQSGSDKILKLMNRPYTSTEYLNIVKKLKDKIPSATFSTDIIVGFPGETDEDFKATQQVMRTVVFNNAYIFKYSPRKGTKAANFEPQLSQDTKDSRNKILLEELAKSAANNNLKCLNKTFKVLVSGESKRNSKTWTGRTEENRVAIFDPNENINIGDIIDVKITRVTTSSLFGEVK